MTMQTTVKYVCKCDICKIIFLTTHRAILQGSEIPRYAPEVEHVVRGFITHYCDHCSDKIESFKQQLRDSLS